MKKNRKLLTGTILAIIGIGLITFGIVTIIVSNQPRTNTPGITIEEPVSTTDGDGNIILPDVTREEGKVNIYLFWGDGCPHCEAFLNFMKRIESEFGSYYNLYKFEVWKSTDNKHIYEVFAKAFNEEANAVPYIVIGEKTFSGFADSMGDEIKQAILEQSKSNFDVYFDKIKPNHQ